MANPNVPQGVLNKIRGTLRVVNLPALSLTASFLGTRGISLRFDTPASGYPNTLTGAVPSPNPYQMATITANALKTQGLAASWKAQIETSTYLGLIYIKPDATTLPMYALVNCVIDTVDGLDFAGTTPDFTVMIKGTYQINGSLFDNSTL